MPALIRVSIIVAWLVAAPFLVLALASVIAAASLHTWAIDLYIHDVYFVVPVPYLIFVACVLVVLLVMGTRRFFRHTRVVDAGGSNPIS